MNVALAVKSSDTKTVIPAEFRGRARQLRDLIASEDEATGRLINVLATRLTDRIIGRHNPIPRADSLKAVAYAWRQQLPPRSRLDLQIDLKRKSLRIAEMRLSSSEYLAAAWDDNEREKGVAIIAIVLEAGPFRYKFTTRTVAHISAHAIARRLQRGRGGTEADMLADLRLLGAAYPTLAQRPDGAEFEVAAGDDGAWVGAVRMMRDRALKSPNKTLLVRTYLADGM